MDYLRPVPFDAHPLELQTYIVPTPSIEDMYERVKKIIRHKTPGAIIFSHPRFGKTYSIRYIKNLLYQEYPHIVIVSFGCQRKLRPSEDAFFTTLLKATYHTAAESGNVTRKRIRLTERIQELVLRTQHNLVLFFADEAQRLDVVEYEWLRDVHDELERNGVRMITLLFGQPQLLSRKEAFKRQKEHQIVQRFMVNEIPFRGLLTPEEVGFCLEAFDVATFPDGSDWTFTRFYLPQAWLAGLRLKDQADIVWTEFAKVHAEMRFSSDLEIPMLYFALSVEHLLKECSALDAVDFNIPAKMWTEAIYASDYAQGMEYLDDGQ